jgi:hypothetical protein
MSKGEKSEKGVKCAKGKKRNKNPQITQTEIVLTRRRGAAKNNIHHEEHEGHEKNLDAINKIHS